MLSRVSLVNMSDREWAEAAPEGSQAEEPACDALFTAAELELVQRFMELGLARDEALVRLISQNWNFTRAAIAWAAEEPAPAWSAWPPTPNVCRCGRSRTRLMGVSCCHCPACHTRTCNERHSREGGFAVPQQQGTEADPEQRAPAPGSRAGPRAEPAPEI